MPHKSEMTKPRRGFSDPRFEQGHKSEHDEALEETARLRDRVEQLEGLLFAAPELPVEFHLTPRERLLVRFLMNRHQATKDSIMTAIYGGLDEPDAKIIGVLVWSARKKLQPFGVKIETAWGIGYSMSEESKSLIRRRQAPNVARHLRPVPQT